MSIGGIGQKVTPYGLRCGVIRDWDARWSLDSQIPEDFEVREKNSTTRVVGKIKEWNNQGDKGMKNVPQKKPHHK